MKLLRFGFGASLILGIVWFSVVMFAEKSKNIKDGRMVVQATTKNDYETSEIVISDDNLDDTAKIMITGTTDIPLYPDAQQVEQVRGDLWNKPGGGGYMFSTTSLAEEVIAFYKRELAKNGWALALDSSLTNNHRMDFVWTNPVKEIPARRYLTFSIIGSIPGDATGADILLRFERWPHPDHVPLYPGAQQVQVTWARHARFDWTERVTSYETEASAAEIEAYYNDGMVQHGWALTGPPVGSEPNLLIFTYRHSVDAPKDATPTGYPSHRTYGTGSVVEVRTYPGEDAKTRVELGVAGDEIIPSREAVPK